jgi:hypothetical protein
VLRHSPGRCRTILGYWIPADDLYAFNANIVGAIDVVAEYG